jgi:hypothetical protein
VAGSLTGGCPGRLLSTFHDRIRKSSALPDEQQHSREKRANPKLFNFLLQQQKVHHQAETPLMLIDND